MSAGHGKQKKRGSLETLIILSVLSLMALFMGIWPVLVLAILGIIACVLRLLFLKLKTVESVTPAESTASPTLETEFSITQKAFGLLQRRITEQLGLRYPGARWVWGIPNAIENFRDDKPLIVLLNSAGGYNKAKVVVHNLMFKGMYYNTGDAEAFSHDLPVDTYESEMPDYDDEFGSDDEFEYPESAPSGDASINYERLAFEWVDANIEDINAMYNESIAQGDEDMIILTVDLPHPDSWPDICAELKRSGFTNADICEDGIKVNISL